MAAQTDTDITTDADFGTERRVIVSGSKTPITLHRPLREPKGRVVLLPGWSGTRAGPADLLVFLASRLAEAGWEALRLEMPGRGDDGNVFGNVAFDDMIATSVETTLYDGPLFILGLCSGGNVALGSASLVAGRSPRVEGLIAISTLPFQPARSKEFEQKRRWKNLKSYASKALAPNTWMRLLKGEINVDRVKKNVSAPEKPAAGERNLKDSARDIEKELLGWKGRGLFIWGSGDDEAALSRAHFEALHAAGMGAREKTAFHTVEGANHNFYARAWREELARKIVEFVNEG